MRTMAYADQACEAILSPAYIRVRRRVLRQLLEAFIYEGIVHAKRREIEGEAEFLIEGRDTREQVVTYVCRGRERFTFGRIRLKEGPVLRRSRGTEQEAESVSLLVQELIRRQHVPEYKLLAFIQELEQTLLKDTFSQHARFAREREPLNQMAYDQLESALMDGHPYHPCYKSRIGFSVSDHYRYGPEFEAEIRPQWVALCKELAGEHALPGRTYRDMMLTELGEEQLLGFDSILLDLGYKPSDYVYLPVHPWQWTHWVLPVFTKELRDKQMIVLGESKVDYRPQQSIRTLANVANPTQSYLKLSLQITNSSSLRSLKPHTLASAPLVSNWLNGIIQSDAYLCKEARVVLLLEVAAAYYEPRSQLSQGHVGEIRPDAYGIIGCLWRESLHRYLESDEDAMPLNGITALEVSGKPLIDTWVQRQGVKAWLRKLLSVIMLPVVHLLVGHGIALESHAQNMVLLHKQGVPIRTAWKDFHEGVEFHSAFLKVPEQCPNFPAVHSFYDSAAPNEGFAMENLQLVRELMTDCLFVMNLGELAMLLEDHYAFEERQFWKLAGEMLIEHFERFPELKPRFEELELFTPSYRVEQLTRRRLYPELTLMVHDAPNPLYQAQQL